MGDLTMARTRYGSVPIITARRRAAAEDPGGGEGIFEASRRSAEEARAQHEELAGLAEVLAPDLAQQEGISVDEARERIRSGTVDPESPLHWLGRNTLGRVGVMDPNGPQGEPIGQRIARARGSLTRREMDIQDQDRALTRADKLDKLSEIIPEASMGPILSRTMRAAGYGDVGDIPVRRKEAMGLVALAQRGPEDRALAFQLARAMDKGGAEASSAQERLIRMTVQALMEDNPDLTYAQAFLQATSSLAEKGGEPRRTPEEDIFTKWASQDEVQTRMQAEEAAAAQGQAEGTTIPTPTLDRYNRLHNAAQAAAAGNVRGRLTRGGEGGGRTTGGGDFIGGLLDRAGVARSSPRLGRRGRPAPAPAE